MTTLLRHGVTSQAEARPEAVALVPNYMLPARWMRYDVLPKNANCKIDRPRLREGFVCAESPAPKSQALPRSPRTTGVTVRMVRQASGQS